MAKKNKEKTCQQELRISSLINQLSELREAQGAELKQLKEELDDKREVRFL
jgi:hypothetical protein